MLKIKEFQEAVYNNAVNKGFWDTPPNIGEKIALIHSELSELLEAYREKSAAGYSEKIPNYNLVEEECADVLIRLLDFCGAFGIDIEGAALAKHEYNKSRPHKHNKLF